MSEATSDFRLFLAEDNAADVFIFREALCQLTTPTDLEVCSRGDVAQQTLAEAAEKGAPPDLIVLDLNLPRLSGLELLDFLAATPALKSVPAVVLSSSGASSDIAASRGKGARAYLVKPMEYERFVTMVAAMVAFWRFVAKGEE
ncbi:MAG: response regulator [Opitutales bacterium]